MICRHDDLLSEYWSDIDESIFYLPDIIGVFMIHIALKSAFESSDVYLVLSALVLYLRREITKYYLYSIFHSNYFYSELEGLYKMYILDDTIENFS
jgi:hypothetical protein